MHRYSVPLCLTGGWGGLFLERCGGRGRLLQASGAADLIRTWSWFTGVTLVQNQGGGSGSWWVDLSHQSGLWGGGAPFSVSRSSRACEVRIRSPPPPPAPPRNLRLCVDPVLKRGRESPPTGVCETFHKHGCCSPTAENLSSVSTFSEDK